MSRPSTYRGYETARAQAFSDAEYERGETISLREWIDELRCGPGAIDQGQDRFGWKLPALVQSEILEKLYEELAESPTRHLRMLPPPADALEYSFCIAAGGDSPMDSGILLLGTR